MSAQADREREREKKVLAISKSINRPLILLTSRSNDMQQAILAVPLVPKVFLDKLQDEFWLCSDPLAPLFHKRDIRIRRME